MINRFTTCVLCCGVILVAKAVTRMRNKQKQQDEEIRRLREKLRKRCDHQQRQLDTFAAWKVSTLK